MLIDTPAYKSLIKHLTDLRKGGKVVVLATGIFDLLHEEHKNYLQKAKHAGDFLVVAIESDVRTRALKGEGRPVHNQLQRLNNVKQLEYVDEVFVLPDNFDSPQKYEQLIVELCPNFYACSSSSPYLDKKQEMVEKHGGKVIVVHQHNPAISTTQLLKSQLSVA